MFSDKGEFSNFMGNKHSFWDKSFLVNINTHFGLGGVESFPEPNVSRVSQCKEMHQLLVQ